MSGSRSLAAALVLAGTCSPCWAFNAPTWGSQSPGLLVIAVWLLALGWGFHALLRSRLRIDDRLDETQSQLGVERHARVLAEHALVEARKALCRLVEQQEGVRETERRRIARDIHDDLGQNLLALKMELSMLRQTAHDGANAQLDQRIDAMTSNLDLAVKSLRGIINDLQPPALEAGLRYAMEWQLSEFSRLNAIRHSFNADEAAFDTSAGKAFDAALFRILQESLSNVARHSQATEVRVALSRTGGLLYLNIEDNGIGFDARADRHGRGLEGVRDRVAALGGNLAIGGRLGAGCLLSLSIPLAQPLACH